MKNKIIRVILPFSLAVILLLIWQILSNYGIINYALFSSPKAIIHEMFHNSSLLLHIKNSLYRLLISVFIGYFLGLIVGIIISRMKKLNLLEDIIAFFMSIPGIAWAPLFIITIGFGNRTIILVGIITAFFPVIYNVTHGMRDIDKNIMNISKIFQYSFFQELFLIKIPAIMNYLLIALKLSIARTWRTIIAVEMIAATMFGLGYMIFDAREMLNTKIMFTGILLSGILYYCIEVMIVLIIENFTVVKWGMKQKT